ncbi:MAG: sigma-54-dependent Fis family transcriptional regulator [Archangium gephyra]|uniref:Sigma-54-dependent Fis family transcriptional regulator n=1 Tax=Archangium gephyra TaxID=48 RepID=A0A2W5T625_9BACT|nr:MAG: sigma-54-dependent Fis family transcriptional regulator [Archangium gephyra]
MAKRSDPTQVVLSVGGLVGQEVNLDEFLHQLVDRIARGMQADRGTLYLVDFSRGELFSRAAHLPELKQIRLKLGQGAAGHVAQHGAPVNLPTAQGEKRFNPDIDKMTGYRTTSMLAVPLIDAQKAVFGVLQVLNRLGGGVFDADDEQKLTEIAAQVSQALQATSLYTELLRAQKQPEQPVSYFFNRVIGESAPMKAIYKTIQKAAGTDATVLLRGESGTGKELFARAVHVNSRRREKPFVKVDCAALPGSLIENELFGHEKGAFTGAEARQLGKFEAANGGTVFIDELGELPLPVQGKLLRVLQDREFERVGGTQTVQVDVRIVAATHRDLPTMVREGKFREDLYYRIKVVELTLPPLRERGVEDIERLARHFVAQATKRHHLVREPALSRSTLERLKAWSWPGNVRELENCIESAVVLCDGEVLPEHLPLPEVGKAPTLVLGKETAVLTLEQVERQHVLAVLDKAKGNRTLTAKWLGIGRNTLARKLKDFGVAEEE